MKYVKKRISVFLAILLAVSTVLVALPTEKVQAATTYDLMWSANGTRVEVEKGAKDVYVGDYIFAYKSTSNAYEYLGYLSMLSGVTYTSSNTKVATVDKKNGKLNAKKKGTTTIKVKYKGKTISKKFKVVSSVESVRKIDSNLSKKEKEAKKFVKKYGNGKNVSKDRYELLTLKRNCDQIGWSSGVVNMYNNGKVISYIVSPVSARYAAKKGAFEIYCEKMNPFSTRSAKAFQVKSVKASGKKITITLKNKVSKDQMFGTAYMKAMYDLEKVKEKNSLSVRFWIWDSNYNQIEATGVVKKGSNKIVVTLKKSMKKGKKYTWYSYNGWTDPKKGTVKAT